MGTPQDQSNNEERAILIAYTVWNLWEENKCRRVIDNKARLRMGIWSTSSGESSKQEPAGGGSIPVLHLPLVKAASNVVLGVPFSGTSLLLVLLFTTGTSM